MCIYLLVLNLRPGLYLPSIWSHICGRSVEWLRWSHSRYTVRHRARPPQPGSVCSSAVSLRRGSRTTEHGRRTGVVRRRGAGPGEMWSLLERGLRVLPGSGHLQHGVDTISTAAHRHSATQHRILLSTVSRYILLL